tara:strand:- start:4973 stop:6667 length:1695 start_codon:yes stop_codon:yes gene_type:complete
MKIFLAQLNSVIGDLDGNAKNILKVLSLAHKDSANLVVTPELSLWGYPPKDLLFQKDLLNKQNKILDKLSTEIAKNFANLSVTIGVAEEIKDCFFPNLYNSIALIENGKWEIIARKIILPTYEVFDEKRYFRSSKKVSILEKKYNNKIWKIGITICEDLWVNETIEGRGKHKKNPVFDLAGKNIDLLLNFSASPFTIEKIKNRTKVSNFAVKHLKIPLIYINQIGGNDDLVFDGNSFVMDRHGESLMELKSFEEDYRCWDLTVNSSKFKKRKDLSEMEIIFDALVLGLKDYARKCQFKTALIGLSGGIDSALVSVIATAALGKDKIFSVSMPSKWSSEHSKVDAYELAKRLDINIQKISIENLFNSFENTFEKELNFELKGITNENIQSRIRGTILMAIANNSDHLLLSTGNKSELAVGYCTLYGDMNGGLSIIGDLYKTNVFKLSKWIDSEESTRARRKYNLPSINSIIGQKILNKPPSAELGPDQLDTDSLPPYSDLDIILKAIIEDKKDFVQLQKKGFNNDLIKKIINLIQKSEFKRKQAPPIIKLSSQSLGTDWRLPIAK